MNQEQNIEQQLWAYIDGISSNEERSSIEKMLQSNLEWKNKYQELSEIHQLMNTADLEHPSMRFTKNVMEKIAQSHIAPATKNYINKRIIWGIGIFFITLLVGFLIYGFSQINWDAKGDNTIMDNVNKINFNKFFNNTWVNAFMMINVVLGLFLLDNYFSNKRKAFRKEA